MYSFLFFGIFSIQVSLARVGLATCTKGDCPEGYFCHEKICKKCLRCDLVFRKGNFCVTDFNDCKDCLEGYEEVLITNFSNVIKPCRPVKKKVKLKSCENDSSCPQNNYCSEESCIKCFDCSLLNRVPPVEKCAKGLNECGSCKIGYYEVSVTTEVNYKPCEKDTLIVPEVSNSYKISLGTVAPICAVIAVLLAAAIILVFKHCKDRIPTKTIYHRPIYPSAPPLYSMSSPQYVRKTEGIQPTVLGYIEEKKQQARVFKQPSALYYYAGEETDQLDNGTPENNDGTTPSSCIPSNSSQSEVINCSSRILLNEHSELALNELGVNSLGERPNENTTANESDSHSINSVVLSVIDVSQSSENSSDDEVDSLAATQNLKQKQI